MRIAALLHVARSALRRLGVNQDAAVAVEFALILPVMLTLYIGGVSVTEALSIDRKVIVAAYTVADLTAQTDKVDDDKIQKILDAATAVIVPYPSDKLAVTVTSVKIDADGKATVEWSDTKGGKRKTGDVTNEIPDALKKPDSQLLWGEASYAYEPTIGYVISGTINLFERTFMRPRHPSGVEKE